MENKELYNEIATIKEDVYTILYMLYNFLRKPDARDFDTFYRNRFKDNKNVEDKRRIK